MKPSLFLSIISLCLLVALVIALTSCGSKSGQKVRAQQSVKVDTMAIIQEYLDDSSIAAFVYKFVDNGRIAQMDYKYTEFLNVGDTITLTIGYYEKSRYTSVQHKKLSKDYEYVAFDDDKGFAEHYNIVVLKTLDL